MDAWPNKQPNKRGGRNICGVIDSFTVWAISFAYSVPPKIQVASVEEFSVDENGTGYLHLAQFTGTTGAEVLEAMLRNEEDGMKRMILDLKEFGRFAFRGGRSFGNLCSHW